MRKLHAGAELIRLQINFINPRHRGAPAVTQESVWICVLPAVRGQGLGVGPALALLSGLTPVPGCVVVVVGTVVDLRRPASAAAAVRTSLIAIHCPGAGHIFQDFTVFAKRWL